MGFDRGDIEQIGRFRRGRQRDLQLLGISLAAA